MKQVKVGTFYKFKISSMKPNTFSMTIFYTLHNYLCTLTFTSLSNSYYEWHSNNTKFSNNMNTSSMALYINYIFHSCRITSSMTLFYILHNKLCTLIFSSLSHTLKIFITSFRWRRGPSRLSLYTSCNLSALHVSLPLRWQITKTI